MRFYKQLDKIAHISYKVFEAFNYALILLSLTLKRMGSDLPPSPFWGFSKNVSSTERIKPLFFVTFNIIIRHIFPEIFIEIAQVV